VHWALEILRHFQAFFWLGFLLVAFFTVFCVIVLIPFASIILTSLKNSSLMSPYGNNYTLLISGAVMSVIPIIVLFFSTQKFFIEGMSTGSVKGTLF
jgi:ABC-type glycerol-3-phosphate transport system permease component